MKKPMNKKTAGSALIEVVLAITILGLVSAPICGSLMVAARINARSRQVMAAQLQVSSAVEQLMAEGIEETGTAGSKTIVDPELPGIIVTAGTDKEEGLYRQITVTSEDELVSVETIVKVKGGGA